MKHKFNAKPQVKDEQWFGSKLECKYYSQLKVRQQGGEVLFFLRQVPFHLPGNVRYVCDFQVFLADGNVEFVDVKGRDTPLSITKRKIVEDLFPIKIKVVSKVA